MPSQAIPLSAGVADLLRDRRRDLGLTLRAVERMTSEEGHPIPYSTLSRIERGRLDPGTKRLGHLMRIYGLPAEAVLDVLDLEAFAAGPAEDASPEELYRRGWQAWQAGNAREGMAAFLALRRLGPEVVEPGLRQKGLLALASAAGTMGKHQFSKVVIEGLLLEGPAPTLLVSVLVQAAKCWLWLGSTEAALAFVDRAEANLDRRAPAHQRAFVFHQRASILVRRRRFRDADRALDAAIRAYEAAGDHAGHCRALLTRVQAAFERGDAEAALTAARSARFHAKRHRVRRLVTLSSIEIAHALLLMADYGRCLATLGKVMADAVETHDPVARFYAHYYLWRVHDATGDSDRARIEFDAAARHLDMLDEVTPETRHVRELLGESRRGMPKSP